MQEMLEERVIAQQQSAFPDFGVNKNKTIFATKSQYKKQETASNSKQQIILL